MQQQQNDQKLCAKDLGEKCSHLGLVLIFHRFLCRRYCTLVTSIFLTILMENNIKMTKNNVRMI